MISLILQPIQSPMLSNLCSRLQQLKLKEVFLYDEGKPMANFFTNNRVRENSRHTLSWPTRFSNFYSTKDSITSLTLKTWKKYAIFEKKSYLWAENKLPPFFSLEQRRPQTYLSRPLSFWSNCWASYDISSTVFTLSVHVPIIKKKSYLSDKENNWPFVSYFWDCEASLPFKLRCTR